MVQVTKSGNIIQHTLLGVANKAAADMVRYASEFGLTPSARARLAVDPNNGRKSKFRGLIGG
jgi:P27 family predicted phage terminase small subunit